jgi:hypothetical protein
MSIPSRSAPLSFPIDLLLHTLATGHARGFYEVWKTHSTRIYQCFLYKNIRAPTLAELVAPSHSKPFTGRPDEGLTDAGGSHPHSVNSVPVQ